MDRAELREHALTQILDPLVSLAFSLRSSPGVYAMLLGSGVSRSASIPTGWEVVLDLIRRTAAAQATDPGKAPDRWYADKYGKEAGYSDLLDGLCRTQIERQQLLKGYFEPNAEERDQRLKLPTAAHHAVAELMEAGLVRVVVTTNFDRLLEQALEQRGIVPVVIGSADQATGMIPLTHQKHCIIKIHGDYLDTRILNTEDELATYDPAMATLIDRVFDEFGLVVCGWSATWDHALRASIERATNRRYACFWTTIGELSGEAEAVVTSRRADVVRIKSADSFFDSLLDHVRGLEEFDRPHPLSVQAAVGAAKRYLANSEQRIRLHDLYRNAVAEAKAVWTGPAFPPHGESPTPETISARIKAYDAAGATVIALNATIGVWSRGEQDDLLVDAISEIGREQFVNGSQYTVWGSLRPYPGTVMLYAAGMASLVAKRPELLSQLLSVRTSAIGNTDKPAVSRLVALRLAENEHVTPLFGGSRRRVAMSDWLHDTLRETFRPLVAEDEDYDLLFDTFEYYFALAYVGLAVSNSGWVPVGAWAAYRHENHAIILTGLKGTEVRYGGKAFAESCDAFTRNGQSLDENVATVEGHAGRVSFY